MLETVIATGLLIVGLAVIGAQLQGAQTSVYKMRLRVRAMMLADLQLAELDLGLVELDSVDEVQEGDFGPRHPDWGWLLTTEETAIEGLYLLKTEVLHHHREEEYREDEFDFDSAQTIHTAYAFRVAPQAIDFAQDFGLGEDEIEELGEKLSNIGIAGLDPASFDPALLAKVDFEELLEVLPLILDAFGIELKDLTASIPPGLLEQIEQSGLPGEEGVGGEGGREGLDAGGERP